LASLRTSTNTTLDPDWDILNEVRWAMQKSGLRSRKIEHIKGHQDRKKGYNELTLKAQLNVDADQLASKFKDSMEYPSLLTPTCRHTVAAPR